MQEIILLTRHISLADIIDILIVALFLYGFLAIIQGRRAYYLLLGLIFFLFFSFFLFLVANILELNTVLLVLSRFGFIFTVIFIIVFQNEIRKIFVYLGQLVGVLSSYGYEKETTVTEVMTAVEDLSKRKIGALIIFEGMMGIRNILEYGVEIDARVNQALLKTIFDTSTPLHDGAVIIQKDRIKYAASILSLSEFTSQMKRYGTRHRAAISATEENDALAIVVSEETGDISLSFNAHLHRYDSMDTLKRVVDEKLGIARPESEMEQDETAPAENR